MEVRKWCGFSFAWKKSWLGWIFESQTASELTKVEILVCSLDFVLEHWKHGLHETVKWTPKGTRIQQRWVILIHFIEGTLNWAFFRLYNRLYFISHTKSYNAFKFSTAVCSDASLGCLWPAVSKLVVSEPRRSLKIWIFFAVSQQWILAEPWNLVKGK